MASNAQKLSAAAEFILDAPPGEMSEVLGGKNSSSPYPGHAWLTVGGIQISERFWRRIQITNLGLRWRSIILNS
jgi:hypothetical protein